MKFLIFVLLVTCAVAYASTDSGTPNKDWVSRNSPQNPNFAPLHHRFRRDEEKTGSVVLRGQKPLNGPDRRGSIDLDYKQKLNDHTSLYGGAHYMEGDRIKPHAGILYEREFENGFINGRGQLQPGPHEGLEPFFIVNGGFRFRRDAEEAQKEELVLE